MKVAFIIPKNDDQHQQINPTNQCRVLPPVGLAHMVGVMGKQATVTLHDERINLEPLHSSPQIAIIFINSYNQQRAFDIAQHYRNSGTFVILTGSMLLTFSDIPSKFANCLFAGSGEEHIAKFLADYRAGKPKRYYCRPTQSANREHHDHSQFGSKLKLAS